MRVDRRLEAQRLLTQSIRKKLLRGVLGATSDGYLGVQDALFNLDERGEGVLDESVFVEQFLSRLKSPLSRAEVEFLLTNVRVRGSADDSARASRHAGADSHRRSRSERKQNPRAHRIDYEQMGVICNLDSDASSVSSHGSSDSDNVERRSLSHQCPQHGSLSSSCANLGADFLAAEKRVQTFLCQNAASTCTSSVCTSSSGGGDGEAEITDTPRSAVTGAEVFLEQAEALDVAKTGHLREQGSFARAETLSSPCFIRFRARRDDSITHSPARSRVDDNRLPPHPPALWRGHLASRAMLHPVALPSLAARQPHQLLELPGVRRCMARSTCLHLVH